jgi:hypothetical protein
MTHLLRRTVLVTGFAVILGLAGIGLAQAAAFASRPDARSAIAPAVLDTAFAADQVASDPAAADRAAGALLKLRFWQRLVHATATLDLPDKGRTTVQLDHGTVAAIGTASLTVAETGGASVTVALGDETRYRKDGTRVKAGAIKTGDAIYVMSLVGSAGSEAYLVVVPKH